MELEKLIPYPLYYSLSIGMPTGNIMLAHQICSNYRVELGTRVIIVNFEVLDIKGLNLIIGTDALSANFAHIDYHTRKVIFKNPQIKVLNF